MLTYMYHQMIDELTRERAENAKYLHAIRKVQKGLGTTRIQSIEDKIDEFTVAISGIDNQRQQLWAHIRNDKAARQFFSTIKYMNPTR